MQFLALFAAFSCTSAKPFPGCIGGTLEGCPGTKNCTEHHFEQRIDHFNWAPPLNGDVTSYKQRYFMNKQWWKPGGPIFFYLGNEDDVTLYVDHTGLMWENAEDFGAMLVFAEHRYYGESLPFAAGTAGCLNWLTTEQALADFAVLIDHLQQEHGQDRRLPVIGFGGSYGGMMASWFRIKYPESVDGVIAGSAPIWSFADMDPPYNFDAFNIGVTYDASAAGGSSDHCKDNLMRSWDRILAAGRTADGRAKLTRGFRTCSPVRAPDNVSDDPWDIMQWAQDPWANMAMGNYPYASSYLMHGKSMLPPWPIRAACSHLDADFGDDDEALFSAVRAAVAVQYNNTGDKTCFDIVGDAKDLGLDPPPSHASRVYQRKGEQCTGDWDFQWCTEMVQPFLQGTKDDMFWCSDGTYYAKDNCSFWNFTAESERCFQQWGVRPRKDWARVALAGKNLKYTSNIVFTNGLQDPWHGGGVLQNISDSVVSVIIPNGAHHIDLMFSDPVDMDYPDIVHARTIQVEHMRRWVSAATGLVVYI